MIRRPRRSAFALLILLAAAGASAAAPADLKDLIREIHAIPSTTGNEELLAARIAAALPKTGVDTDNLGSVVARFGRGGARLALCAPLDDYGWFVSGYTSDGYLRLDRVAQPQPNYDGYLLGQPVVISTRGGLLHGIVAQPSMHLITRELREQLRNFSLDSAYVDIGARSEEEARARGIERLDAVTLWPDLSLLAGDKWAGVSLGQKAACALLLGLADEMSRAKLPGEVALAWMAQSRFPARSTGAGAPRAALGAVRVRNAIQPKFAVVVDGLPADRGDRSPAFGKGPALVLPRDGAPKLKEAVEAAARDAGVALQTVAGGDSTLLNGLAGGGTEAVLLGLPLKFGQTPSEVVDLKDVQALKALLLRLAQSGRLS